MINFPTSLDTLQNPTSTTDTSVLSHSDQHANANDAIEALEAKVGINSSANTDSLDYKLTSTSSSNPGHKHTLASGATDVTSSAAELNIMDGVTASTAELNIMDGVTATTAEINKLAGIGTIVTTDGSQSLSNKTLTAPKFADLGFIADANGNELMILDTVASAVNEVTLANAATGTSPTITASGETNVGLDVKMKGTGKMRKPTVMGIQVVDAGTDTATGDGKAFFRVPEELNGMNLTGVAMSVYTAGTTGTTDVQIRNKTDSVDMLSTKLTIDSGETDTSTAATAAVIDTTKDDVVTGDIIAIDVDAVSTTKAKGLYVQLRFELP